MNVFNMTNIKKMLLVYLLSAVPFFMAMPTPFDVTAKIFFVLCLFGLISPVFYVAGFFSVLYLSYNPQLISK